MLRIRSGTDLRERFLAISLNAFLNPFVQYFRPQTVYVSQLFIQIIAYILGIVLEEITPGPGNSQARLQTKDTTFWRFMNPGPFSKQCSTSRSSTSDSKQLQTSRNMSLSRFLPPPQLIQL